MTLVSAAAHPARRSIPLRTYCYRHRRRSCAWFPSKTAKPTRRPSGSCSRADVASFYVVSSPTSSASWRTREALGQLVHAGGRHVYHGLSTPSPCAITENPQGLRRRCGRWRRPASGCCPWASAAPYLGFMAATSKHMRQAARAASWARRHDAHGRSGLRPDSARPGSSTSAGRRPAATSAPMRPCAPLRPASTWLPWVPRGMAAGCPAVHGQGPLPGQAVCAP